MKKLTKITKIYIKNNVIYVYSPVELTYEKSSYFNIRFWNLCYEISFPLTNFNT
jgi:hypothetical protein